MAFVEFSLINMSEIHFNFSFDRRINFIRGKSGTGKTYFYDSILEYEGGVGSLTIGGTGGLDGILSVPRLDFVASCYNKVLVFDEVSIIDDASFMTSCIKYIIPNNLVLVFLTREEYTGIDLGGHLSYSLNAVYQIDSHDNYYTLIPHYEFPNWSDMTFDIVLTEDTGAGYRYFSSLFKIPVRRSSGGKSTLNKDIQKLVTEGHSKILVLFDSAAYGCHMERFAKSFLFMPVEICYLSLYECFEELLCQTTLVRKNISEDKFSAVECNKCISWETYFENLIAEVTQGKLYYHNHNKSNVADCYIKSCVSCRPKRAAFCGEALDGTDKFEATLRGTKYEFLLDLIRRS